MLEGRWRRAFMVVFGALAALAGVAIVISGEDLGLGIACIAFGGASLAIGSIRPAPAGDVGAAELGTVTLTSGRTLHGTRLVASQQRLTVLMVGSLAFGVVGIGLMTSGDVVLGGIAAVLFGGGGLLMLLRGGSNASVLLAPEGVAWGQGQAFVPWDAVRRVGMRTVQGNFFVDLVVRDRSALEAGRVAKALLVLNRSSASIGLNTLSVDPLVAFDVVTRLFEHPEDRALLVSPGGEAALERLKPRLEH